jgi:hypothetical protein
MLARLFELVCLVEEQIRERDSTIVGIQRVMEDVDEQNRRHWADREAQHRTQMLLVKERYNGPGGAPTSSAVGGSSGTQSRSTRAPTATSSPPKQRDEREQRPAAERERQWEWGGDGRGAAWADERRRDAVRRQRQRRAGVERRARERSASEQRPRRWEWERRWCPA